MLSFTFACFVRRRPVLFGGVHTPDHLVVLAKESVTTDESQMITTLSFSCQEHEVVVGCDRRAVGLHEAAHDAADGRAV